MLSYIYIYIHTHIIIYTLKYCIIHKKGEGLKRKSWNWLELTAWLGDPTRPPDHSTGFALGYPQKLMHHQSPHENGSSRYSLI